MPATFAYTGQLLQATVEGVLQLPAKIPGVVAAIFGAERDVEGPAAEQVRGDEAGVDKRGRDAGAAEALRGVGKRGAERHPIQPRDARRARPP